MAPAPVAGSSGSPPVTPDDVMAALASVFDPELGMSIVDLGLVYGIDIGAGAVSITMTLTTPGCPIHDAMAEWVEHAVMAIAGVSQVRVHITFDPPWTPDRITAAPRPSR
jgi:metal-sulfur cluster biosynthetic enzyme